LQIERFVVPPLENNTYLLFDDTTSRAAVIDPALGADVILGKAQELGAQITHILNTHGHPDHICDNRRIKEATGAKLCIHELDAYRLVYNPFSNDPIPPTVDILFKGGEILEIGTLKVEVIHTPGHTEGGCCYYLAEEGVIFTGDTLFAGNIGRTDLDGSDPTAMLKSLKKLFTLPKNVKVYPGHGYLTTIEDEYWMLESDYIERLLT
jgi:glyoxylase-like metal-dependent hydrolase (beta-lactamase superfamily II)